MAQTQIRAMTSGKVENCKKACLFDMDGLLINTEDMYTKALNKVLAKYDKGKLSWDLKLQLQGLPGSEAGRKVLEYYNLPLTLEDFIAMNTEHQKTLWPTSEFLPGTVELIDYLKKRNVPIALCTSSTGDKFLYKTSHLKETFDKFDVIITGDDSRIPKGRGKPFPDIWELGLKELNTRFNSSIESCECIVFEDGIAGVKAGKSFGAHVVWIPHPDAFELLRDEFDLVENQGEVLSSMEQFDPKKFQL